MEAGSEIELPRPDKELLRVTSANFYVNMKCEIADNLSNGFIPVPEEDFTNAVYTAAVFGTDGIMVEGDSLNYILIEPPENAENAYETDALLRSMATQPYEGMTIHGFPSDEDVLHVIRQSGH